MKKVNNILNIIIGSSVGVWCIYPCCVTGLRCDKSNHQTQRKKNGQQIDYQILFCF